MPEFGPKVNNSVIVEGVSSYARNRNSETIGFVYDQSGCNSDGNFTKNLSLNRIL
jgi:hypothetical protein